MKGNHNDGMGMRQAVSRLATLKNDMLRCFSEIRGYSWEDEFDHIIAQMRKRIKTEGCSK